MSYYFHSNQLQGLLAEQEDYEESLDMRSVSRALRFLEGIDFDEEPLRFRRGRRGQRASKDLFSSIAQ